MSTPAPHFLYVWEKFSIDYLYHHGLAFAVAPDLDTARYLVMWKSIRKFSCLKPEHIVWGPVTILPLTELACYVRLGEDL
jgi:hypothetical protein